VPQRGGTRHTAFGYPGFGYPGFGYPGFGYPDVRDRAGFGEAAVTGGRAARRAAAVLAAFLVAAGPFRPEAARAAAAGHVLVFGFEMTDTSGEGAKPEHAAWLDAASELLAARLREAGIDVSGPREAPPGTLPIRSCNGCEIGIAAEAGAGIAATGAVHKVSSLILSITIALRDVETGRTARWAADIRGDSERAWLRGVDWLAEHRVLPQLLGPAVGHGAGADP
jgi:Protein of unknown function (DUF2380)